VIDSHCHLAGAEFEEDLAAVVQRAQSAGVARALVILAADAPDELTRWPAVQQAWPDVRAAVGIHPHQAAAYAKAPGAAGRLLEERLAAVSGVVAVGEIGLDYHYDFAPRSVQQAVFETQLRVAVRRGLPVVIHTREAEEDTLRILRGTDSVTTGGVFHCFSGDRDALARALETGFYISVPGIVTFPRAAALREALVGVPRDRVLVETDSPYLAPVPLRGTRNEPANVARVVATLAGLWNTTPEAVGRQVSANFDRLFGA
jgi:TatD DNase family protein